MLRLLLHAGLARLPAGKSTVRLGLAFLILIFRRLFLDDLILDVDCGVRAIFCYFLLGHCWSIDLGLALLL